MRSGSDVPTAIVQRRQCGNEAPTLPDDERADRSGVAVEMKNRVRSVSQGQLHHASSHATHVALASPVGSISRHIAKMGRCQD